MKTRIIVSAVLLPVFFAVLFFFPPYVLTAVVSLICAIAAYELLHATSAGKNRSELIYTVKAAVLIPVAVYLKGLPGWLPADSPLLLKIIDLLIPCFIFIFICLLFIEAIRTFKTEKQVAFRDILTALFGGILIPYMLSSLISLKILNNGHLLVLLPIVCAFMTDSGAYFTGVATGKRKAFPNVSPGKTVEGCIGGLIAGTAGMLLYGVILANTTTLTIVYPALLVYGLTGAVVTELGDLAFSLVKREYDIKDYGKLMPGHGGMLDRFDSMIFTAPAIYLMMTIWPAVFV